MKIKYFGRNLELIKVDKEIRNLQPQLTGVAKPQIDKVFFDDYAPFSTLLHEIFHCHENYAGIGDIESYSKETTCNMFAACIEQLIIENGNDVFGKLKRFAEGEK